MCLHFVTLLSVWFIYLQIASKKQTSQQEVEKAKVAGQIKMQVLLECTKSVANWLETQGVTSGRGGGRVGGENCTKLSQVQEMGEWMSDWLMQPADKWFK